VLKPREGIARGVDPAGALLLETEAGIERVLAGDVNLVSEGS
jgi:biotin-(acetyl-CoA carboxylase) ligase